MDSFTQLLGGFESALEPTILLYCFLGVFAGTLVGALPGLGPTAAIALLIPVTAEAGAIPAIVMLAGIYYGAMYGGSITAVLLNMPGEAASVPTTLDGNALARSGRAGPALVLCALASFAAGTFALIVLILFAPRLADLALGVGPAEYFALTVLALTILVGLAGRSVLKAVIATVIGFAIYVVGIDPVSGTPRLTFGSPELLNGFDFVPVMIGLFAVAEVLENLEDGARGVQQKVQSLWPTRAQLRRSVPSTARGSLVGTGTGLLPGGNAATAAYLAYDLEKKVSKRPEEFGKGAVEGMTGAEAANNAVTASGMIPLLTLGIPASPPLALLAGAFIIHGVTPGPLIFDEDPELIWAVIASMYVGNVMLLVLNIPLVRIWVRLLRTPYPVLVIVILAACVVGAYATRNSMFDVYVMAAFGVIGYLMRKADFPASPVILAMILAPIMEQSLRESLAISAGSFDIFTRPGALALLALAAVSLAFSMRSRAQVRRREVGSSDE